MTVEHVGNGQPYHSKQVRIVLGPHCRLQTVLRWKLASAGMRLGRLPSPSRHIFELARKVEGDIHGNLSTTALFCFDAIVPVLAVKVCTVSHCVNHVVVCVHHFSHMEESGKVVVRVLRAAIPRVETNVKSMADYLTVAG